MFSKFETEVGIIFKDREILKQAFTHRSFLNENPSKGLKHNERLEFLGDAVLELIITEHLYKKYTEKAEGEMTSLRAALVNAIMLSEVASEIKLGDYLLLSKGEAKDMGKARQYILANTFEAVVGAIYLDQGYEVTHGFLEKYLFSKLEKIVNEKLWIDAKSLFQEKAQDKTGITPSYSVIKEEGPDHAKNFTVGIYLGQELVAQGGGSSKQEAEQDAASHALEHKNWGG
jgi:ribonuclease-3